MTLQFAAMFGLVIPLEELERLLRNMSAQEVAHTLPDEDADGKNKKD
jgi:HAMP domain-containing protein